MADKGFDIESDLPNGISLNIAPLLHNKENLSLEEETETRRIASVRIHVEQAIARVKNLRILSTVFLISMVADLNKILVICSYLTNFTPTSCGKRLIHLVFIQNDWKIIVTYLFEFTSYLPVTFSCH